MKEYRIQIKLKVLTELREYDLMARIKTFLERSNPQLTSKVQNITLSEQEITNIQKLEDLDTNTLE